MFIRRFFAAAVHHLRRPFPVPCAIARRPFPVPFTIARLPHPVGRQQLPSRRDSIAFFSTPHTTPYVPFPDPERPPDKPPIICIHCPDIEFKSYTDLERHYATKFKNEWQTNPRSVIHWNKTKCEFCGNGLERNTSAHDCPKTIELMDNWWKNQNKD